MTTQINNILTILECVLINAENPHYLEVSYQHEFIFLLLMKPEYQFYTVSERIQSIYKLLEWECGDILREYPIIVECYDSEELTGLMKLHVR